MTYIVEHTAISPPESFLAQDAALRLRRRRAHGAHTAQTILVDYAGLGNLALHITVRGGGARAVRALLAQFRRHIEIVAETGRYINVLENFTAETLGPRRYREFLLPVYEECFPVLRGGKIVGCHYDGQTAVVKPDRRRAVDLIESLTRRRGRQLAEARAVWPDKLLWAHINLGCHDLPAAELRRRCWADRGGRSNRLAFEVSEQLPARWLESMPVVLDALAEARACFA